MDNCYFMILIIYIINKLINLKKINDNQITYKFRFKLLNCKRNAFFNYEHIYFRILFSGPNNIL